MKRIDNITKILDFKKAEDITTVDMNNSNYMVDYVIIATVLNTKHGMGLLDELKTKLKPEGEEFLYVEEGENWIVIDMGDVLIHLMSKTYRETYNIEEFLKSINKVSE